MKEIEYIYYFVCVICIIMFIIIIFKYLINDEKNVFEEEYFTPDYRTPLSNNFIKISDSDRKYYSTSNISSRKLTIEKLIKEFGKKAVTTDILNIVKNRYILEDSEEAILIKARLQKNLDKESCPELKRNTFMNLFLNVISTGSFIEKKKYTLIKEKSFSENDIENVKITDKKLKKYDIDKNNNKDKSKTKVSFTLDNVCDEQV